MEKSTNKNNMLTGYLLLFIALQGVNLAIAGFGLIRNARGYYLIMMTGGWANVYSFILGTSLLNIVLITMVIIFFLKRNQAFIKIYIASVVCNVLSSILGMTIQSMLGIVINIVMLFFWLNYFKNSTETKVYLKSRPVHKRKTGKMLKTKHKLRVVK